HAMQFLLTPRSSDNLFERLVIRFQGVQLVEMRLSDSLGQESTVHFVETQINNPIPDEAFVAELPEGTDVIRDLPVPAPAGDASTS
ncbi:MAG: outer-membrane lipoprotein carrier protein LolA, partial [Oleiphilaceae bacterium]|nr:outer-membrane lipoprotein carrier protein LolA [Oleiphilaceae bacterium]